MWYLLPSDMLTLISSFWNPKEFRRMLTPGTLEQIDIYIYIYIYTHRCLLVVRRDWRNGSLQDPHSGRYVLFHSGLGFRRLGFRSLGFKGLRV